MFVMTRSNGVRSAISAPPFSTHASSAGVSSYGFSASEKPSDVISIGGIVPSGRISIFSTHARRLITEPFVMR